MSNKNGMGSHQSHKFLKDEWLTPPSIIEALGSFDLDPCAPISPPWNLFPTTYTIEDNGLKQQWSGRVFMNPPYGKQTGLWLEKLTEHGNGIALIFARTETKMFFDHVWKKADAVFFFDGRLFFHHVDGTKAKSNSGAPSCLVAYGKNNVESIEESNLSGKLILINQ